MGYSLTVRAGLSGQQAATAALFPPALPSVAPCQVAVTILSSVITLTFKSFFTVSNCIHVKMYSSATLCRRGLDKREG
jgi:hypothetical protein